MTRSRNVAIALAITALGALAVAFGGTGQGVRGMNVLSISSTAGGTPDGIATTASGTPEGIITSDRTRNIMFETLTAPTPDDTNN